MDKRTIIEERGKHCKIDYNKDEGKVTITLAGYLTTEDKSDDFIEHYINLCKQINRDETILILDSTELKVFEQEFLDQLEGLYRDYALFKKVYCIKSKAALTNNQAQRLLRKLEIQDKFTFVDSISDIK